MNEISLNKPSSPLLIKNARVIDPKNKLDALLDVAVADGCIVALGRAPESFTPQRTIDATGWSKRKVETLRARLGIGKMAPKKVVVRTAAKAKKAKKAS